MEKSKVIQAVMSDTTNRKFVSALSLISNKSWVVALNEVVQELIDDETITSTTELIDDVASTMTSIKQKMVVICTP